MPLRRVPALWIDLDGNGPLWAQLHRALREAILAGRLAPGSRLPSTRTLAAHLGLSRSTVLPVYEQLLAEGWLVARHGSGTVVSSDLPEKRPSRRAAPARRKEPPHL